MMNKTKALGCKNVDSTTCSIIIYCTNQVLYVKFILIIIVTIIKFFTIVHVYTQVVITVCL